MYAFILRIWLSALYLFSPHTKDIQATDYIHKYGNIHVVISCFQHLLW